MEKSAGIYRKTYYAADLRQCSDGEQVFDLFLVSKLRQCANERSVRWLSILLSDRSGTITAKMWPENIRPEYEGYESKVVIVKGRIGYYSGRPELIVELMQPLEAGNFVESEICRCPTEEVLTFCERQIVSSIGKIQSEKLRAYVNSLYIEGGALHEMKELPVRVDGQHHAYRGGLIEHVSEVTTMAYYQAKTAAIYRTDPVSLDMVIAGALLHDAAALIQKPAGYGAVMEDTNRLMGYRYAAHSILNEGRQMCWIPEDLYARLIHIVDSSHEAGPLPLTAEAMIVRSANLLSITMGQYDDACQESQQNDFVYSKRLRREIYRVGGQGSVE